jgi:hypothetical protein
VQYSGIAGLLTLLFLFLSVRIETEALQKKHAAAAASRADTMPLLAVR